MGKAPSSVSETDTKAGRVLWRRSRRRAQEGAGGDENFVSTANAVPLGMANRIEGDRSTRSSA
jgi:hypothetical protein